MKKVIYTAAMGICLVLGACSNDRNADENTQSPAYDEREQDEMNDEMNRDNTNQPNEYDTSGYNNNTPNY